MTFRSAEALALASSVMSLGSEMPECGSLVGALGDDSDLVGGLIAEEIWAIESLVEQDWAPQHNAWLCLYARRIRDLRVLLVQLWNQERDPESPPHSKAEIIAHGKSILLIGFEIHRLAVLDPGQEKKKKSPGRPRTKIPREIWETFVTAGHPRQAAEFKDALRAAGISDLSEVQFNSYFRSLKYLADTGQLESL